jgi:hypothetical protein
MTIRSTILAVFGLALAAIAGPAAAQTVSAKAMGEEIRTAAVVQATERHFKGRRGDSGHRGYRGDWGNKGDFGYRGDRGHKGRHFAQPRQFRNDHFQGHRHFKPRHFRGYAYGPRHHYRGDHSKRRGGGRVVIELPGFNLRY